MNLTQILPYIAGIIVAIGGHEQWMYGALRKERDKYYILAEKREETILELKDQINQLKIKIIKLEASQRSAFFDGKDHKR